MFDDNFYLYAYYVSVWPYQVAEPKGLKNIKIHEQNRTHDREDIY
jgi:hypothetical protein